MLRLILGRAGSGKTYTARKILLEKALKGEDKLLLLVPEQSSFENEKIMLNILGASVSRKLEITTFTRLIDFTFRKVGGFAGKRINNSLRAMIMSLAIEQTKPYLNIYKAQAEKPEFVNLLVDAIKEFKTCGVSSKDLKNVMKEIYNRPFKDKLYEIAMIFDAYEAIVKNSYVDPIDDLTHLYRVLCDHSIFNGYTVVVDSFDGFTNQEYKILSCIIRQAKEINITLCVDAENLTEPGFDIFSSVRKTALNIISLAKRNDVKVLEPLKMNKNYRFHSKGIYFLEKGIFQADKKILEDKVDDVTIFNARDVYDEIDYVARTIKKLVVTQDVCYRDVLVISRSFEDYEDIVDAVFPKYDIPFFIDRNHVVTSKPLMSFAITVFDVAESKFKTEYIFKLLKTGVFPFSTEEICILENYVLLWSIEGKDWLNDFEFNPRGFSETFSEQDIETLKRINIIRSKVINPLKKFVNSIKETTAQEISKSLYYVMKDFRIDENLVDLYKKLKDIGKEGLAQEQVRLWQILMDIIDQMTSVLVGRIITPKRYKSLLKLMIDSSDISFIPQGLDQVRFGTADRIKPMHPRIVFVIGAIQGKFPLYPSWSGVFSDIQRKELILLGLPLYECLEKNSISEQFMAYRALTSPSEHLYIVWSKLSVSGNAMKPSSIVLHTKKILPFATYKDFSSEDKSELLFSEKISFEQCAKYFNENSIFSNTLKKHFMNNEKYKKKMDLFGKLKSKNKTLSSQESKSFFGNDICLSASQIEKFYLCKFQYFCQYGICARPRKRASFDALEYGNLVHFVLERIVSKKTYDFDLRNEIENVLKEYLDLKLGGVKNKTCRFKYLFSRLVTSIEIVVRYILDKTLQSKFKPTYFEAQIKDGKIISPLKFSLRNGKTVKVEGKVDRIDIMNLDGKDFVRIIDYKTGSKKFDLSDVLYGLNLQMLIYLLSIVKNGKEHCKNVVPAGILYMPTTLKTASLDRDEQGIKKVDKKRLDTQFKMNGLVLKDTVSEMDKDSNINTSLNLNEMDLLLKKTSDFVLNMAEDLLNGDISSKPVLGELDACEYCEYSSVCGFEQGDDFIESIKLSTKDALKKIFNSSI